MRILALFSSTANDLGIDHRIGRQVLKLAVERAKRLRPEVSEIDLVVHNEIADCKELSLLPNFVAEQFYLHDGESNQCDYSGDNSAFKNIGQTTTLAPTLDGDNIEQDPRCRSSAENQIELDEYLGDLSAANSTNLVSERKSKRIDAIIGPSCDPLVDIVARMAAYWRTPIYTITSINAQFARKDVFSTLTRLSPSIEHLSMFMVKIMKSFKWRHMAILVDKTRIENEILLENLERTINHNQHSIPIERVVLEFNRAPREVINSTEGRTINKESPVSAKKSLCTSEMRRILMEASQVARVMLLLLDDNKSIRSLLLCGHELDMNNGEYTFIAPNLALKSTVDLSTTGKNEESKSASRGLDWFLPDDEANNLKARRMFESLMVLSVEQPVGDEYNAFVENTLDLANQAYPEVHFERSNLGPVAVALHDSLLLAVEAHWLAQNRSFLAKEDSTLLSSVEAERDEDVSQRTAALMWNTTYTDGLMTSIHINGNGDQELDYVLSDLEPEMGSLRPVASYSKLSRQVQMLENSYIHWPARFNKGTGELMDSEEAPPDEPECGFDGNADRCVDRQNLYAILTVLLILLIISAGATAISVTRYKRIKYQMKLDDYWWRINWDDLMFINAIGSVLGGSILSGSGVGKSVVSGTSNIQKLARSTVASSVQVRSLNASTLAQRRSALAATDMQTDGSKIGNRSTTAISEPDKAASVIRSEYSVVIRQSRLAQLKDDFVIVKQLNAHSIEVNRNLLVELKSMRELCHENLARFVGLCIEPGRLAIVGEYCSRGSLRDLLENTGVAMDLTLKYSILGDIINGLNFIHTSLLNYHGRLKSTNLVLDSRFTVKLTDFGLKSLYCQLDAVEKQDADDAGDEEGVSDGKSISGSTRRPSLTQTIYQMDSVSMYGGVNPQATSQVSSGVSKAARLRNRGAVRYFWTAPEHLRDKCPHFAGSKRGDIYSLAIIMFELFTRKEPYFYGTNATPNWAVLKRIKQLEPRGNRIDRKGSSAVSRLKASRMSIVSQASSQLHPSSGTHSRKSRLSTVGGLSEMIGRQTDRARDRMRKGHASVKPQEQSFDGASVVSGERMLSPRASVVLQACGASNKAQAEQPYISVSTVPNTPIGEEPTGSDQLAINDDESSRGKGEASRSSSANTVITNAKPSLASGRPSVIGTGSSRSKIEETGVTQAQADEILDQLRMGVQPEPVRPFLPNFVLQDVNTGLIELMRACWQESPNSRPSVERVRSRIKKITAGVASKNYLDNLLERLQTYAAELERIVDEKSADIIAEKARTEGLLYQLVPKFVADKLKHHEPIIPQLFDGVTVFFSDIVGFEKYSAVMSPIELVDLLNNIYSSFESIINSFDVIKIEVILDQFLVASGISLQDSGVSGGADQVAAGEQNRHSSPEPEEEKTNDEKKIKGSKSTRKILNAIRLTQSTESSPGENRQQQQVEPSEKIKEATKTVNTVTSTEHYKRNCAEQIARMALCIRDLVKSFHFRQTLSRNSGSCVGQSNKKDDSNVKQSAPGENEINDALQTVDSDKPSTPRLENIVAATFNIRIGIHSGKVCAGIVGLKRPKFCLIGDTVNVASRMHTNSKANKIQISAATANLLRDVPGLCTMPRGKIDVKGKGQMETYWLEIAH